MMTADSARLDSLLARLSKAEDRLVKLEEKKREVDKREKNNLHEDNGVKRVKADLLQRGIIYSSRFFFVPSHYYDLTLEERARLLQTEKSHLCKTILFENTVWDGPDEFDPTNARYYCVIIQYVAKINITALRNLIHSLRLPASRLSKNSFNFQLAPDAKSYELSGFEHNALAPFGLKESRIPIVICSRCLALQPALLYLGGGHVDAKLLLPVNDLVTATNAIVGLVTDLR
eukprot:gene8149-8992_t